MSFSEQLTFSSKLFHALLRHSDCNVKETNIKSLNKQIQRARRVAYDCQPFLSTSFASECQGLNNAAEQRTCHVKEHVRLFLMHTTFCSCKCLEMNTETSIKCTALERLLMVAEIYEYQYAVDIPQKDMHSNTYQLRPSQTPTCLQVLERQASDASATSTCLRQK